MSKSALPKERSIYVVGQGAVGSLFGAFAMRQGHRVEFVARQLTMTMSNTNSTIDDASVSAVSKECAVAPCFTALDGHKSLLPPMLSALTPNSIEYLIVPTKAYQAIDALTNLRPFLKSPAHIIVTHNGLGTMTELQSMYGNEHHLYFCSTSIGAMKTNNGITQTGCGISYWTHINKLDNVSQPLSAEQMSVIIPQAKYEANLDKIIWTKLAINCVINPLTAINDCLNGDIAQPAYRPHVKGILVEVIEVALTQGVVLALAPLVELVLNVAQQTATNSSSMRQDVINKRQTEIDYINGYITRLAKSLNIPTPNNQYLTDTIKSMR